MRYVRKGEEPDFMKKWKEERRKSGQSLAYNEFDDKKALNECLRKEQHQICCYCQQKLDHFQGEKTGGSHNEHLVPENGPFGDFDKQMDYNNLFACCIDSRGLKKKERSKRHCGESKEDRPIRGFITEKNCRNYFRYNILGEIIPNGDFDCWKDYVSHKDNLTSDVRDAFETIEILNLNCHFLVEDRKGDLDNMLRVITNLSKEKVDQKMQEFSNADVFPRYIDMLLYFMGKKK